MTNRLQLFAIAPLLACVLAGCGEQPAATPETPSAARPSGEQHGHSHSHAGDDALVWVEEGIEHAGAKIALGHHGEHVHAGHELEPAVTIERDGEPVADAEVFNSLLSADGEVLVDEVATIYEPTTAEEPAHYAQGSLAVPSGVDKVTVRYRICLGDGSEELTKDVTLDVD